MKAGSRVRVFNRIGEVFNRNVEDVLLDDLLWDGEEFVIHDGVYFCGYEEVIRVGDVEATRGQNVWTSGGWQTAEYCKRNGVALEKARSPGKMDIRAARDTCIRVTSVRPPCEGAPPRSSMEGGLHAVYGVLNCGPRHRYMINKRVVMDGDSR